MDVPGIMTGWHMLSGLGLGLCQFEPPIVGDAGSGQPLTMKARMACI